MDGNEIGKAGLSAHRGRPSRAELRSYFRNSYVREPKVERMSVQVSSVV